MKLGTVITTPNGPSVTGFSFVIQSPVKRGEFVSIKSEAGLILARVENIYKTNKYFESAGAVQEYSRDSEIFAAFPVKEWEYTIADVRTLGIYSKKGLLERPTFPPSPGDVVERVENEVLNKFLGLDQKRGLHLGEVQQHNLPAKFNLTRMIQKHLAVLAISGAGKSYAVAVLIEELLSRKPEEGRIAIIVIDNHGEYGAFGKDPQFKDKVKVIEATNIRINASHLNEKSFAALVPGMSSVQIRELGKVISQIRKENDRYSISELIEAVENTKMSSSTKDALLGWLADLDNMHLFAESDYPNMNNLLEQGKMVVLNFKDILNLRKKQIIVNYISRGLFDLRKQGLCPPYLEIIEEAHNFCPEGARAELALSRAIIETLAREGRKFFANICLISQRPVQLSTTALSQCNTQIIFRVTNPYDLDHIRKSSEAITGSTLDMISSLRVGEALVIGEAVNHPMFIKIRKRKSLEVHGEKLEDYARRYEKNVGKPLAKGEEFL